jgi:hypothetical protein
MHEQEILTMLLTLALDNRHHGISSISNRNRSFDNNKHVITEVWSDVLETFEEWLVHDRFLLAHQQRNGNNHCCASFNG